jgi:hypothetical protein
MRRYIAPDFMKRPGLIGMWPDPNGDWVPLADAEAAIAAARADVLAHCIGVIKSFDWDVNTGMDFSGDDILAALMIPDGAA